MKSKLITRFNLLLIACLMFGSVPTTWAEDYASLIAKAREQVQNEDFIAGLAAAEDAVRANPQDCSGHYYVAAANLGLNRFDDAEAAVAIALSQASETAKPGVEKLAAASRGAGVLKLVADAEPGAAADGGGMTAFWSS